MQAVPYIGVPIYRNSYMGVFLYRVTVGGAAMQGVPYVAVPVYSGTPIQRFPCIELPLHRGSPTQGYVYVALIQRDFYLEVFLYGVYLCRGTPIKDVVYLYRVTGIQRYTFIGELLYWSTPTQWFSNIESALYRRSSIQGRSYKGVFLYNPYIGVLLYRGNPILGHLYMYGVFPYKGYSYIGYLFLGAPLWVPLPFVG